MPSINNPGELLVYPPSLDQTVLPEDNLQITILYQNENLSLPMWTDLRNLDWTKVLKTPLSSMSTQVCFPLFEESFILSKNVDQVAMSSRSVQSLALDSWSEWRSRIRSEWISRMTIKSFIRQGYEIRSNNRFLARMTLRDLSEDYSETRDNSTHW